MLKRVLILIISVFLLVGCASKRYTKKGVEFEAVGYYEQAAEMYYKAVVANENNVEAHIGLRKTGQISLNQKLSKFKTNYEADKEKDAVNLYLSAEQFYKKLMAVKCSLEFSSEYTDYYNDVKGSYLEKRYQRVLELMSEEQFSEAEVVANEIIIVDFDYLDIVDIRKVAHYEPIYRKGKEYFVNEKFRTSYYNFDEIVRGYPDYKDAISLRDEALLKAIFPIEISSLKNKSLNKGEEVTIANMVKQNITDSKSPFVRIVDRGGAVSVSASSLPVEGMQPKAKLLISVDAYRTLQKKPKIEKKRGYIKEVISQGEGKPSKVIYNKVEYYEVSQSSQVYSKVSFQLIGVKTGEILVSDVIVKSNSDNIHYAKFDGNTKKLIPGYWKDISKDSPEDVVKDNTSDIRKLKNLLNENRELRSISELKSEINKEIAKQIARKVIDYDPEKH